MSAPESHRAGQEEGESRKDAAHALLEARREVYIRRARRALLLRLLDAGTATADDVAERIGPTDNGIDPRWLGTVPGPLAIARIIRRARITRNRLDRAGTLRSSRSGSSPTAPPRWPGSLEIQTFPSRRRTATPGHFAWRPVAAEPGTPRRCTDINRLSSDLSPSPSGCVRWARHQPLRIFPCQSARSSPTFY